MPQVECAHKTKHGGVHGDAQPQCENRDRSESRVLYVTAVVHIASPEPSFPLQTDCSACNLLKNMAERVGFENTSKCTINYMQSTGGAQNAYKAIVVCP